MLTKMDDTVNKMCNVYLLFICFDPSGEFVSSLMQYGSGHCSTWVRMKQRAGSLAHAEQLIPVVEHVVCRLFNPQWIKKGMTRLFKKRCLFYINGELMISII